MKFDVIIATYNREKSLEILVKQILECSMVPENIIIVDSSNKENLEIQKLNHIKYIRASYGNQPYQRYVGYLASNEEFLVFFDDDMRILDKECFKKILKVYQENPDISGIQPNFTSIHHFFDKMPQSIAKNFLSRNKKFSQKFKKFTGYPILKRGHFWMAGIKGDKPKDMEEIEWFYGPVFSAKRDFLYKNFNFLLFDIFKNKIGMGEDAILGYTLSLQAPILYLSESLFHHDDQSDSIYSSSHYGYGVRTAYSRLYLSNEYCRLTNSFKIKAFIHFIWYGFWRILGLFSNVLLNYRKTKFEQLKGYFVGYIKAIGNLHYLMGYDDGMKWKKDAQDDIKG